MRHPLFALLCCAASALSHANHGPRPVATPDVATTQPGVSVLIAVMDNDFGLGPDPCLLSAAGAQHGRLRVEGDLVRYTPRAGFTGVDEFNYRAQQTNDGRIVKGRVTVTVGAAAPQLRLQGRVVDAPAAGALVEVALATGNFSTTTDAAGNYALSLPLSATGMVVLSVTGTSATGAALDFRSLVGDLSRLTEEAGADRALTGAENHQVNASPLSTAHFVIVERLNGGDAPQTDARLRELTQATDGAELLAGAASLRLILQGGAQLPAGFASAFELIQNSTALAAFQAGLPPGLLDTATAEAMSAPGITPDYSASNVRSRYGLIASSRLGSVVPAAIDAWMLELDTAAAGAGSSRAINVFAHPTPEGSWQLTTGGDLSVSITTPRTFEDIVLDQDCPQGLFNAVTGQIRLDVRRLLDGDGFDVVQVDDVVLTTPIPTPECDPAPLPPPTLTTTTRFAVAVDLQGGSNAELPVAVPTQRRSVGVYRAETEISPDPWSSEIYPFDTTVSSPTTWFIQNGRLIVNHTGGQVTESIHLQSDGAKGSGLFVIATLTSGVRTVTYGLSVPVDGTGTLAFADLVGLHVNGFTQASQPSALGQLGAFYMRLDADGNARTISQLPAFPTCGITLHTWRIENGQMIADRVPRAGVTGGRTWLPLARAGSRLYVIEQLLLDVDGEPATRDFRPNYYDLTTQTPACIVPPNVPP